MARIITGKESISGWLYDTLAALTRGDHDSGEAQLSELMGDVKRLAKPTYLTKGFKGVPPGFAGEKFGLSHTTLKQLEAAIDEAQSFVRGHDLKSAAAVIRQAFDDWTK